MTEQYSLDLDEAQFAKMLFDHVREMSKDVAGVTRQGYGPLETQVLEYLKGIGGKLDLDIQTDLAGNVWMTLPGTDRTLPAFVSGSHADSVPQGGNYDGLAGIVAALCAAHWMRRHHYTPKRDFTVLMMRCEESSFFGKAYVGSLGMMGKLTAADLALKHRSTGETLGECIRSCGVDPERLTTGEPVIDPKRIAAFVELHIEQGPILEAAKKDIGVVTCVLGMINYKIKVYGQSDHAGTTPMPYRQDALYGAAKVLQYLHDELDKLDSELVYTTGEIYCHPNVHTVIPDYVEFSIDARHEKPEVIEQVVNVIKNMPKEVVKCKVDYEVAWTRDTVYYDKELVGYVQEAVDELGYSNQKINSGAGHDAQFAAYMMPTTMVFVPSKDGHSHCEPEYTSPEQCTQGASVLLNAVLKCDADK